MANRPVFNGAARVWVDNNPANEATREAYVFRAQVGSAPGTGNESITNGTFETEAGAGVEIFYDIRRFGGLGTSLGAPDVAFLRVFKDDDSQAGTSGAEVASADLLGALPVTGSIAFNPTTTGTYRISLELRLGANDFSATSDDWTAFSDAALQGGTLSLITRAVQLDKGRVRAGTRRSTGAAAELVTQAGSAPATGVFAVTNPAGSATVESVRASVTFAHDGNKSTAVEVYTFTHRRNGTSTDDASAASARQSSALYRTTQKVNQILFPVLSAQVYALRVTIVNDAALHTANTPQYTGLGGSAASGNWTHFVSASIGFVDYESLLFTATHTVNSSVVVENVFVTSAAAYAESSGVPTGSEIFAFIATADNMKGKAGRVVNARSEPLVGSFVRSTVKHIASDTQRDQWGLDSTTYDTDANGWQGAAKEVIVSTPPAGPHSWQAEAYYPSGSVDTPASREYYASRMENSAPASAAGSKDWIAPASFSSAIIVTNPTPTPSAVQDFSVHVYDKDPSGVMVAEDADATPTSLVQLRTASGAFTSHATPVLTKRAGTTGIYDGQYTVPAAAGTIIEVTADVSVGSFLKRYGTTARTIVGGSADLQAVLDVHNNDTAAHPPIQAELDAHQYADKSNGHPGTIENADVAVGTLTQDRMTFTVLSQAEFDAHLATAKSTAHPGTIEGADIASAAISLDKLDAATQNLLQGRAEIVLNDVPAVGTSVTAVIHTFGPAGPVDVTGTPTMTIYKRTESGAFSVEATPTVTKRAGTTGLYDVAGFTVSNTVGDVYEWVALVTMSGGTFAASEPVTLVATGSALPTHVHNGADYPRVSYLDLNDLPAGTQTPRSLTVLDDSVSQTSDGLRELPVVETGYGDPTLTQSRAGSLLNDRKTVDEVVEFTADLKTEPHVGDNVAFSDTGKTLVVTAVKPISGTTYRLTCGTTDDLIREQTRREQRRIENLERYQ